MFYKLIVITTPEFFVGEAAILNQLFRAGLKRLHIRKPQSKREDIVRLINKIEMPFRKRIAVHYHKQLVIEMGLGGMHFGYPEISTQPDLADFNYMVSCSVHQWSEFESLRNKTDYCFISPVFDSISKSDYQANKTLKQVPASAKNVYALGGITVNNFEKVLENGYAGIAVLGHLWEDKNLTLQRFNNLQEKMYAYGI